MGTSYRTADVPSANRTSSASAAPAMPTACTGISSVGARYLTGGTGVRCGGQSQSPSGGATLRGGRSAAASGIPASNPPATTPMPSAPPPGYRAVWEDDRLNEARGGRATPLPVAAEPNHVTRTASVIAPITKPAPLANPAPVATMSRYVQVGTYGQPANVQAAVARIRSLGYGVNTTSVTRKGVRLQSVLAGPYASQSELRAALAALRAAGYSDAYVR